MSKEKIIYDDLMALDITKDKIMIVLDDLLDNYFEDDTFKPKDRAAQTYFNNAEIRLHIIRDYITALEETLNNMYENMKGMI